MRRGAHTPTALTRPSTKKSDGAMKMATIRTVDGSIVLPETLFGEIRQRVGSTRFYLLGIPTGGPGIKNETAFMASNHDYFLSLSPEVICTRGYVR